MKRAVTGRATGKRSPAPLGEIATFVGQRLRAARLKAGLSQEALGHPYYGRGTVSAFERGRIAPSIKTLAHFARRLRVPLRELIPPDI